MGGEALIIQADVADPDAVETAATQVERELGPIDIWINNAAAMLYGRIDDLSPEEIRRVSDVTYHGTVWGTQAALKRMRARGQGTIVQVGSGAAYRGIPLMSAYCAAKHAIKSFTESLRSELIHDGVKVHLTMVNPSSVNTPLYTWARNHLPRQVRPIGPTYQPEAVAETIYWAAHARRREVHFGWGAIVVIAANKVAPGLVDRELARVGFEGQQTSEPVPMDHQDNLMEPIDEDMGAHGMFDEIAISPARLSQAVARLGAGGLRAVAGIMLALTLGSGD